MKRGLNIKVSDSTRDEYTRLNQKYDGEFILTAGIYYLNNKKPVIPTKTKTIYVKPAPTKKTIINPFRKLVKRNQNEYTETN